jgi:hypothetical protein
MTLAITFRALFNQNHTIILLATAEIEPALSQIRQTFSNDMRILRQCLFIKALMGQATEKNYCIVVR